MKRTIRDLDRLLGRDALRRLVGEKGGRFVRIPTQRTLDMLDRIDAVHKAIDNGMSYRTAARTHGLARATVEKYSKK